MIKPHINWWLFFNYSIIFFSNFNFFPIKICLILIFALGLCADKNVLSNPKIRFLFQILILFCLIYFNDLRIPDLRLDFLNKILLNQFFNLFLYILYCNSIKWVKFY